MLFSSQEMITGAQLEQEKFSHIVLTQSEAVREASTIAQDLPRNHYSDVKFIKRPGLDLSSIGKLKAIVAKAFGVDA